MNLECCKTIAGRLRTKFDAGIVSLAIMAIATIGCAEAKPKQVPVFPVKGSITFKGAPAVGAALALHPKTPPAEAFPSPRASVGSDGSFKLTTYNGGDGAPAGEYVLTVLWYKPVKIGADMSSGPNVLPPKLARPETSDQVIVVEAGENNLPPLQL